MKQVLSVRDLNKMLRQGKSLSKLPKGARLTPAARDFLRDLVAAAQAALRQTLPAAPASQPVNAHSPKRDLAAFFNSPRLRELKLQICDIGRRMWQRAYVDGNGGNIVIKVADDLALCTPTLVSKGFMQPEDLCLVDLSGRQLAGSKKITSEILMHLQMIQRQPRMVASVHGHPPYSTAFAVVGLRPPTGIVTEYELFDSVALAPYRTPGTPELGKLVADLVDQHNTILMANHGVVAWSHLGVEDAYFKLEILEAYCRILLVASHLDKPANTFSPAQLRDLLKIKQKFGIPDPRHGLPDSALGDHEGWRPGGRTQ